ncbi:hypothetical protein ONS95_001512 [Cadophora gregata]|uniref:uncharacterized protein n=1 Tax=Cadophora gregata TaxID=51156 RepID=UPI0026DBC31A|nr:uncharacterized protein ONS95_001512 [Cadophora gregata]KAK0111136.1 hypothetical protein ONS95_001512 [Cadophora gregata]KAK0112397.1 hypothetical protein ONS96_001641 [Cadophora gregata f. sp. sojae]
MLKGPNCFLHWPRYKRESMSATESTRNLRANYSVSLSKYAKKYILTSSSITRFICFMSPCLEPNLGDNTHDGRERQDEDSLGIRNMASSWGSHCDCQKYASGINDGAGTHHIYYL